MTTGETIAVIGVGITAMANFGALVWGAAKMSGKVEQANKTLEGIQEDFSEFLVQHRSLEKLVGTHTTAIAVLSQATGVKLRKSDLVNMDKNGD